MKLFKKITPLLSIFLALSPACVDKENLKLTREDRLAVDGASNNEIIKISNDMDVWCRDSSAVMIKKAIDSLLVARQSEINKATSQTNGSGLNK